MPPTPPMRKRWLLFPLIKNRIEFFGLIVQSILQHESRLFMRNTFYILVCSLLLQACTVIRLYNSSTEEKRISIVSSDSVAFASERIVLDRDKKSSKVTTDVTLTKLDSGCILEFNLQPKRVLSMNNLIIAGAGDDQNTKYCILDKAGTKDTLISVQGNKVQKRLFTKRFKLLWIFYHYEIK